LIAIDEDWGAFAEDCRRAAIVISPLSAPLWCRDRAIVIDRAFVRKNGATAIRFGTEDQLETVDSARGARPWVVRPGPWRALNSDGATPPDDPAP
jgi:competence protein ComEC